MMLSSVLLRVPTLIPFAKVMPSTKPPGQARVSGGPACETCKLFTPCPCRSLLTQLHRFSYNLPLIERGCSPFGVANPSEAEIHDVYSAIETVAAETGVDSRFILAIALQESNACVRAPTTNYGVRNPGIMQDHNGAATCNEGGRVLNPCPATTIYQMIKDGVAGTAHGDGLKQTLHKAQSRNSQGAGTFYIAARIYNSGSVHASGALEAGGSTHCYASDIANRLVGWRSAQKTCSFDGAPGPAFEYSGPSTEFQTKSGLKPSLELIPGSGQPKPAPPPVVAPPATAPVPVRPHVPVASPAAVPDPVGRISVSTAAVPVVAAKNRAISSNKAPGVTNDCSKFYQVRSGDFCDRVAQKFGTTFAQLRNLNKELNAVCSNLWLGYDYCVEGI